jgi:hypothetical protein
MKCWKETRITDNKTHYDERPACPNPEFGAEDSKFIQLT